MKEPGHRTKTGREQKRSMLGELFKKYKDIIAYGIFGILTTIVNIIVYWAAAHLLALSLHLKHTAACLHMMPLTICHY